MIPGRGLRRSAPWVGALVLVAVPWWSFVEADRLVVNAVTLPLPGAPPALDGLRIAALGDIHAGAPHVDAAKLRQVVARTNAARPELVVLLGDYVIRGVVGGRFIEPEVTARILAELRAPLGRYAVLGNHDWWYDGERVRRAFQAVGIPVLENERVRLERPQGPIWILGLADLWTRRWDLDSLRGVPAAEPVLALTHNPDVFPELPARISLTLAAHTHGGQVRLPLVGSPIVPSRYGNRYASGAIEEGGRWLFVTPGIGTSIVPLRFGVPPEVSLLTLVSGR